MSLPPCAVTGIKIIYPRGDSVDVVDSDCCEVSDFFAVFLRETRAGCDADNGVFFTSGAEENSFACKYSATPRETKWFALARLNSTISPERYVLAPSDFGVYSCLNSILIIEAPKEGAEAPCYQFTISATAEASLSSAGW